MNLFGFCIIMVLYLVGIIIYPNGDPLGIKLRSSEHVHLKVATGTVLLVMSAGCGWWILIHSTMSARWTFKSYYAVAFGIIAITGIITSTIVLGQGLKQHR